MPELPTMASCSATGLKKISAKFSVTFHRRLNQSSVKRLKWTELIKKKENTHTESNNNINTYIKKEKKHSTHEIREDMTRGAASFDQIIQIMNKPGMCSICVS